MEVSKGLTASQFYLDALPETIAQIANGCGPGGWKIDLIPDTVYGLSIKEACNVHDVDYLRGKSAADKEEADNRFLCNCLALVEHATGFWATVLRPLRRRRVLAYYEAVKVCGESAFWAGKERVMALEG